MSNLLDSFIPKYLVDLNKDNDDVIVVSTRYLSPEGDEYVLDKRVIAPIIIQTTQSIAELQPEVSYTYPFKIVTPVDYDGATLFISPSVSTQPTASQGYYIPLYFERYTPDVMRNISKNFTELSTVSSE